jgi:hypothetical protein
VIRIRGRYFVLDVVPWLGYLKEDRNLRKTYGDHWWRYGRLIGDRKETIEQSEIVILFQRCLRIVTATGWKETLVRQLIDVEQRWFNRPRNNILYNFTGWTDSADLTCAVDNDVSALLKTAARNIFDYEAQAAFGPLPQSLLLGSFLGHTWTVFRDSVSMELNGVVAPEFPDIANALLIGEFEKILNEELSESA